MTFFSPSLKVLLGAAAGAAAFSMAPIAEAAATWHHMTSGCASNIAAANGNNPWITGCNANRNNIYYWNDTTWIETNGTAENIAAYEYNGQDYAVIVGTNGKVYYGSTTGNESDHVTWSENTNGLASGVGISVNYTGYAYIVGNDGNAYYSSAALGPWTELPYDAALTTISVAPDNSALFILNPYGSIGSWTGTLNPGPSGSGNWAPTFLNQYLVTAGLNGSFFTIEAGGILSWIMGVNDLNTYFQLPAGPSWINMGPTGWGTWLSVGTNGNLWAVDENGSIWYCTDPTGS
jgi:hypothetical protein